MVKAIVSTAALIAMQFVAAVGFTVLIDEAGFHTDWYHVLIGFMWFNATLWAFLALNDTEVSILDTLRKERAS
jgi:hypothetical protein